MVKKRCDCCLGINASIPVTADKYTYTITSVLTGKLTWTPIIQKPILPTKTGVLPTWNN